MEHEALAGANVVFFIIYFVPSEGGNLDSDEILRTNGLKIKQALCWCYKNVGNVEHIYEMFQPKIFNFSPR